MLLALNYPSWISPEIIPGIPFLRWYGLMYIVAFSVAYFLFRRQVAKGELIAVYHKNMTDDEILDFFFWGILGLLLGARIFSTLIYDTTTNYWSKPWLIFWPFDENWNFTGLAGMSYHGGFVGGFLGMFIWMKKHKFNPLPVLDLMAASIPLGYTFGRLGNFFNAELYGRITKSPIGMIFPNVPLYDRFNASEPWVQAFANEVGIHIPDGAALVNLPRHPSQLYEALFEGVVLWLIIWLWRKKKPFNGFLTGLYTMGYGIARFVIEYFRQPDADLGYRLSADGSTAIYKFESIFNISTGQVLSAFMILGGLLLILVLAYKNKGKKLKADT